MYQKLYVTIRKATSETSHGSLY